MYKSNPKSQNNIRGGIKLDRMFVVLDNTAKITRFLWKKIVTTPANSSNEKQYESHDIDVPQPGFYSGTGAVDKKIGNFQMPNQFWTITE